MSTMTQQERQAAREAYIAYAIQDVQIDEDEHGTYAMMLSAQRDIKRYKVRVRELPSGEMFAESCVCPAWNYRNPEAMCCKHMEAFNVWHMRIHRSVTVMPVADEPVEMCASAAPQTREQAPCKAAFPTRKAFVAQLKEMDPAEVLFPGWRRSAQDRSYAVVQALQQFIGEDVSFGQSSHCIGLGAQKENPKWFAQLFTDLSWDSRDITPGWVLYHLNLKPAKKSAPKQARTTEERMERATLSSAANTDWLAMLPSRQKVG